MAGNMRLNVRRQGQSDSNKWMNNSPPAVDYRGAKEGFSQARQPLKKEAELMQVGINTASYSLSDRSSSALVAERP